MRSFICILVFAGFVADTIAAPDFFSDWALPSTAIDKEKKKYDEMMKNFNSEEKKCLEELEKKFGSQEDFMKKVNEMGLENMKKALAQKMNLTESKDKFAAIMKELSDDEKKCLAKYTKGFSQEAIMTQVTKMGLDGMKKIMETMKTECSGDPKKAATDDAGKGSDNCDKADDASKKIDVTGKADDAKDSAKSNDFINPFFSFFPGFPKAAKDPFGFGQFQDAFKTWGDKSKQVTNDFSKLALDSTQAFNPLSYFHF